MSVEQIKYGGSAVALRAEFPGDWDLESLTGVTVGITDSEGGELLAASAATLYSPVTLSVAASVAATSVTLAGTPGSLKRGDRLLVAASDDGPRELVEVEAYNSSTGVLSLRDRLNFGHAASTALYPAWATYSLDASDTATFEAGAQVTILWTPDIDAEPVTQLQSISKMGFSGGEIVSRFRALYPTESDIRSKSLLDIQHEAVRRVHMWCESRSMPLNRLVDQELLFPSIMEMMAYLIASAGGDGWSFELDESWTRFTREFELLASLPVWTDDDQDLDQDREEVTTHKASFTRRGI